MSRLKKLAYEERYDLDALREDLEGEEKAIFQYKEHIKYVSNNEIKEVLTHIMEEEEHHAKELRELIEKYSKTAE